MIVNHLEIQIKILQFPVTYWLYFETRWLQASGNSSMLPRRVPGKLALCKQVSHGDRTCMCTFCNIEHIVSLSRVSSSNSDPVYGYTCFFYLAITWTHVHNASCFIIQGVKVKMFLFFNLRNLYLAYISQILKSSQHNESLQSRLLAGLFLND